MTRKEPKMSAQVNSLNAKQNDAMNSTYFNTSDVIPFVDQNNEINMWNGRNYQASWGSSNVTSKVTRNDDDLVVIDVTGWHKHTVSPVGGTYYFVNENGQWNRKRANAKAVKQALGQ